MSDPIDPAAVETASSEACTRAGAFALLLSIVLFLLIPYWLDRPKRDALRDYLTDRMNLALQIEKLDDDPRWQNYKSADSTLESHSIAELMKSSVVVSSSGDKVVFPKSGDDAATATQTHAAEPSPPTSGIDAYVSQHPDTRLPLDLPDGTPKRFKPPPASGQEAAKPGLKQLPGPPTMVGVTITEGLSTNEVSQTAELLRKLNDSEMLTRSVQVSNYFNNSIVRWINKRDMLVYRNYILKSCSKTELEVPHPGTRSRYFVPALYDQALLGCLSVEDVRELVNFESPAGVYNPPQFGERIGEQIDINPGALPRDPYLATILTQILLFFVLMYFYAFARDAVSQTTFPSRGTLFGAFHGTRMSLLVFVMALWTPLLASLVVCVASRQWPIFVCTLLIFAAVVSTHLMLNRESYWVPLMEKAVSIFATFQKTK